jgi:integrase
VKCAKPYPYLYKDIDRQGHIRWRLRAPRRPTVTIKGEFGSPEFASAYRAAIEDQPVEPVGLPGKHGTFDALGRDYLRSADFVQLAPETQRTRRRMVETFLERFGALRVATLEHRHVRQIMGECAGKPGVGRNLLSTLHVLIALAIADGIRKDDPTVGIKRPKLSRDGWHSWTEDEIAQYETRHPVGSRARLGLALALYTAQRASDLIRMGKQHLRDGGINVVQQKTGTRIWIKLHSELNAILDATPSDFFCF